MVVTGWGIVACRVNYVSCSQCKRRWRGERTHRSCLAGLYKSCLAWASRHRGQLHTHCTYHKATIALRHGTGAIYPAILRAQDTDERACNQQRRHGSV